MMQQKFQDMYDYIHVDEKWFSLMTDRHHFLLPDEEIPPQHLCLPQRTYHKGNVSVCCCMPLLQYVNKDMVGWKTGNLASWCLGSHKTVIIAS